MKKYMLPLVLLYSGALAYAGQNEGWLSYKELDFQTSYNELPSSIRRFVDDYKTWSKEDQQKIKPKQFGYVIEGKPNHAEEKYGESLGYWLDCRLTEETIGHFINAVAKVQDGIEKEDV